MTRILLTHPVPVRPNYFPQPSVEALAVLGDLKTNETDTEWTVDELIAHARDCDIVVNYRETPASAEIFDALPSLKAWVRVAVDIRNIDLAAASRNGVLVTNASGVFVSSVAEWTIAAMIDVGRRFSDAIAAYRAGRVPAPVMGPELKGATLGLIGYGRISRYLVDLALAFGMRVVVCDPHARVERTDIEQVDMDRLLAEADHVVCLAVANAETENLIDASVFRRMKRSAFFINPSRGNLVDESALLAALDQGLIAGCALDVGRADDQMPTLAIARHPRAIATPHLGGLTPSLREQSVEAVAQVADIVAGRRPGNALNAEHARRLWP
ncbi:MAG: hydroxyacid dehydrogenase [Gammaproteobacteria bacterium]|nr:hydroxyacid dehydrogenase [Gammaproteobacteria bacterium]MBU1444503.1 hydroxyacid dehydrogenase [Gammaproteobacteria bacterium]MBU2407505.1 hydroxyacid dehydrogenase [Gammaproteobacteria bacterium]